MREGRHRYRLPPSATTFADLTPRQREVARLVAAGCSNPEIARELCIAPQSVRNHLKEIGLRLGGWPVSNHRVWLARLVWQHEQEVA